ncbi:unnamed protein product [Musa acuminata subsp. malaccensis]|uniref:(wild Malaysian banana) hypothetical protein n=1 Tax=Musa acuminata subsp. malaccensis TaxID=214687 RepID=A0A804IDH8_MUSAM|nr:unnamed protein product [Musa acuminata subsp. malaccensis]
MCVCAYMILPSHTNMQEMLFQILKQYQVCNACIKADAPRNRWKNTIILTCGCFIVHRSLKLNPCYPILKQLGREINCECTYHGFISFAKMVYCVPRKPISICSLHHLGV